MRAVLLGLSLNLSFAVRTSHYADEDTMTWRGVVPNRASEGMWGPQRASAFVHNAAWTFDGVCVETSLPR